MNSANGQEILESKFDLQTLTFGQSTAESEVNLLYKYFVSTPAYLNAKNRALRKVFYIGHRGAGKSALFKQLTYEYGNNGNSIILPVTPEEYSYSLFKDLKHDFNNIKVVYGIVWHYTLLVSLFKATVNFFNTHKHVKKHKEDIKVLQDYLEENDLIKNDPGINMFLRFLAKFDVSKIGIGTAQLKLEDFSIKEDPKLLKLYQMDDIKAPTTALQSILSNHSAYIFIDELDTGWDNSGEARNFIYGLFYAVNKLKERDNVNIFLSLRKDMYNNLPNLYADAEKMRDNIEVIHWDKNNLRALIGMRILNFLPRGISKALSYMDVIDVVFEPGVLDYIINHTLNRPREVIQFCNQSINILREAYFHNISHRNKITLEMVKMVELDFYNNRIKELCQEYQFQYPNLKDLLNLFEDTKEEYNFEEFKEYLQLKIISFSEKHESSNWVSETYDEPLLLVESLYEIGFIKIFAESVKSFYAYYEMPFNSLRRIRKIKIHSLFFTAFSSKS